VEITSDVDAVANRAAQFGQISGGVIDPLWVVDFPVARDPIADDHLNRRPLYLGRFHPAPWFLLAVAVDFIQPLWRMGFLLSAVGTGAWIARRLSPGTSAKDLPVRSTPTNLLFRSVQAAGVISYSVYLLHQPILHRAAEILKKLSPTVEGTPLLLYALCLLTWPLILLVSTCYYRLVEIPSIRLGKQARRVEASSPTYANGSASYPVKTN